jgi:glycosyltransferase involved in cell wall biosynthesis
VSAFLGDWIAHHDTPATVYHLHNWHKYLSPAVFTALAPVVERLVMTLHDYFLVCPNGSFAHFPRGRPCDLEPMTARCLCSACDKRHYGHKLWRVARHLTRQAVIDLATTRATLVAVHGASLDLMRRGGVSADRIRVLHNPVEPWCLQRVEAERNHEVFFVGRLEKDKGADVLVRACERLGANVTLIGSGPLGPVLEGRRGTRLLGQRTRSEIAGLVRAARMLVIPSRWRETFGLVALEAAMSGIPVIVSDLVPFSADLQRIGAGVVWRSSDEVSLETEISRLASDDAAIGEMSRRGFTEARSLAPTPDAWCTALLALYSDVLGAGRAGVETERVPRCAMYDR